MTSNLHKKQQYRRLTNEVSVGNTKMGGQNPIRLQSMTNTKTLNTNDTVKQCIDIAEAGADYVRITAQSIKAAENLKNIKTELRSKGYFIPLIADIHFSPKAATIAAGIVDKVRINPGNFIDSKKFKHLEFSDKTYSFEIDRLKEKFIPFLNVCKTNNCSVRIGTNHGSLSDRIMSRYGDTPIGMVESTMEFLRICREENFHDVVISMKSGNPIVMIETNRLLVKTMQNEGMNYPIHLGVTEAGEGEDGRIKSAVGIATVLADGIGDTIRVSLTEDPEKEIPVAKSLKALFNFEIAHNEDFKVKTDYEKRKSVAVKNIGGENTPIVIADLRNEKLTADSFINAGFIYNDDINSFEKTDFSADCVFIDNDKLPGKLPDDVIIATEKVSENLGRARIIGKYEIKLIEPGDDNIYFVELNSQEISDLNKNDITEKPIIIIADLNVAEYPIHYGRELIRILNEKQINNPLIVQMKFDEEEDDFIIKGSAALGSIFIDYGSNGVMTGSNAKNRKEYNRLSFGILQACRLRITKTEYISCPSCGRTLFDLQKATASIKEKTAHLKGLKIGIMGCIVNGPGEMADSDYGYVGAGAGKINLYKKKIIVKKNIPEENAVEELLALIESDM